MQPTHQKTSIFSQFSNNTQNSVTSKQLQEWLIHMAPTSHSSPKFNNNKNNNEWNLMSTSSRYESDGMTFGQRIDTFESGNKQNFLNRGNLVLVMDQVSKMKQLSSVMLGQNSSNNHYESMKQDKIMSKSKSYISAMQQLQKRAKTLQQQNTTMRRSLLLLQQQKRSSLQSSLVFEEQIKSQIFKFNQIDKKNQQLKRQNKKLRDSKNQQSMKVKLMDKTISQHKQHVKQLEQRLDIMSKQNDSIKKQLQSANVMIKSLLVENKQLVTKTQMLQNMKQKSTNSILQKYAKAIQRIQQLELTISEIKNISSIKQSKMKKIIEEKDQKYLAMVESVKTIKLQKQQLVVKTQVYVSEIEEKSTRLSQCQKLLKDMERNNLQADRNIHNLTIKLNQCENNCQQHSRDYMKLRIKYNSLKEKVRLIKKREVCEKDQGNKREMEEDHDLEAEDSLQDDIEKSNIHQQIDTQSQQSTPVQRYDMQYQQPNPNYQHHQQQDYHNTKPLSIIKNAKNTHPKIRDQIYNYQPVQFQVGDKLAVKDKQGKQSHSKDSKNSQNATLTLRHKSPKQKQHHSKPSSQQPTKPLIKPPNSFINQSFSRSKSSSIERKGSKERKSISIDSKKQSRRKDNILKSREQSEEKESSSKSRLVVQGDGGREEENRGEEYLCQSAQPTRYPATQTQRYFYSGEINTRQPYLRNLDPHSFHHTPAQQHTSAMIFQQQSKTQLNKALLLEYQQQALKLYEQHERLLELSQNEDISSEQKAQILGRIRQVMLMIDHNTEKIFSIKGSSAQ